MIARLVACASLAALPLYWWTVLLRHPTLHLLGGIVLSYFWLWGVASWWSHAPKAELARRCALTSASIVLVIGCLELLALTGAVDYRSTLNTPIYEPWKHPDNVLDATLLHLHKPHLRTQYRGIAYRYDRHGFRNATDFDAADVVVLGDSFIEGWNVSADELVTAHLGHLLRRSVANLGQSWYGPQQQLEVLKRYALPLGPKTVVWAFFEGNDLQDWHRYELATQDWERFSAPFHSLRRRSFTWNAALAVQRLLEALDPNHAAKLAALEEPITGVFEDAAGNAIPIRFWYKGLHLSAKDVQALEEMPSVFQEAHRLCRSQGARLLVVFVPTTFRVYKDLVRIDPLAEPAYWVVNDLPTRLESIARDESSEHSFLDLTPRLTAEARRGTLVYFADDTHWSPAGHRVAAAAIAETLMRTEAATGRD